MTSEPKTKRCNSMGSRLLRLNDAGLLEESKIQPANIPVPQPRKERKPTKVTFTDIETGEVTTYDSIYNAVAATGHSDRYLRRHNGEILLFRAPLPTQVGMYFIGRFITGDDTEYKYRIQL